METFTTRRPVVATLRELTAAASAGGQAHILYNYVLYNSGGWHVNGAGFPRMISVDLIRQCFPSDCYARQRHRVVRQSNRQQQAFVSLCAAEVAVEHHLPMLRVSAVDGQYYLATT